MIFKQIFDFAYILLINGQILIFRFYEYFFVFRGYLVIIVNNYLHFVIFSAKIAIKTFWRKNRKNKKLNFHNVNNQRGVN